MRICCLFHYFKSLYSYPATFSILTIIFRHESKFIEKIVKVVGEKLSRPILGITPYLIGIHSRAKNIHLWLQDGANDVGMVAICGMGGIGKTIIAKYLYNLNFSRFEGSSFLANVRETSKQQDGLLRLQKQLLSDILRGRKEKIHSVDEGIVKIKSYICCKRVLVILDDVDTMDQLEAILGMRDWLFPGSKIIITTRHERLLRARGVCHVHRVEKLDYDESLELFSWYAFGKNSPIDGFMEDSENVVHHCGGLLLAIKILGSSLSGRSLNVWKNQLEKLKKIPDKEILEKLKISYNFLQDDHDRNLFLHIACFFVGMDEDLTISILDGCDFYTTIGIQNLIDSCLLTIDERKKLVMHQLVQEMGREIVRQESPEEPGERTRLWNHKDSLNVLRENTGTRKIEGLILDMNFLKEDKYVKTVFGVNRKRRREEFIDTPLLSNVGNSFNRYCFGIFSSQMVGNSPGNPNKIVLEVNAFAGMHKLKLLQLNYVQVSGSFKKFPKGLRWLCWHGFPFKSIHRDFPLESLVALDMRYSSMEKVWEGTKGCHQKYIFDAYLPGSKVPAWFNLKNKGSSVSFIAPSHLNFKIRGLSVCSIYALSNYRKHNGFLRDHPHTIISNTTKSLIWGHQLKFIGIPEVDEDMMWLSYWKFENQLEGGDELNISVVGDHEDFQVKEVGVRLVYKEQEEKSTQSASEESSQQISLYGNVVPGNASAIHPASKKVYCLSCHAQNCSICSAL